MGGTALLDSYEYRRAIRYHSVGQCRSRACRGAFAACRDRVDGYGTGGRQDRDSGHVPLGGCGCLCWLHWSRFLCRRCGPWSVPEPLFVPVLRAGEQPFPGTLFSNGTGMPSGYMILGLNDDFHQDVADCWLSFNTINPSWGTLIRRM